MNKDVEKSDHRYRSGLLLAQYSCIMLCRWPHDFGSISWWFEKNVGSMWGIYLLIPCSFKPCQNSANMVRLWIPPVVCPLFSVVSIWQCLTQWFTWATICQWSYLMILTSRWSLWILLNRQILNFWGLILRIVYWKLVISVILSWFLWWGFVASQFKAN